MEIDLKSGFLDIYNGLSEIIYSFEEKPPITIRVVHSGQIEDFKKLKQDAKNIRQDAQKAVNKSLNYVKR